VNPVPKLEEEEEEEEEEEFSSTARKLLPLYVFIEFRPGWTVIVYTILETIEYLKSLMGYSNLNETQLILPNLNYQNKTH
jgi:transcription antitermination factor NusG